MDALKLLPCPFCGGEARLFMPSYPLSADCADAVVRCSDCDAAGQTVLIDMGTHDESDWPDLEAEAITAWNTRAPAVEGEAEPVDQRPSDCRNRLAAEGKPHPKSGCGHCRTGGITGCPFEHPTPEAVERLVEAAREFVREYDGFEDGDGHPCPVLAGVRQALAPFQEVSR